MSETSISNQLFGMNALDQATGRVRFHGVIGGQGSPVLLLHGYPQTHACWHAVAPALSERHTVVVPDLPGYGDSDLLDDKPWNKRLMADELVALMRQLGHEQFAVVGHDRGARVGYRLALDHPDRVSAYASLAVVPLADVWPAVDSQFAMSAYHWFLLAQPGDLPARTLGTDPDAFIHGTLDRMAGGIDRLHPLAVESYRQAFAKPSVRDAIIEDYRAAWGADREHEESDRAAGRKIACPVLVIWAAERLVAMGRDGLASTAVEVWQRWADDVRGVDVPCGHLIPEQAAEAVVQALVPFLTGPSASPSPL